MNSSMLHTEHNTGDPLQILKNNNLVSLGKEEEFKEQLETWKAAALQNFPIRRIGEIEIEPPSWLGEQFLEEGTIGALIGESGVGKSFLAIDFALSIATGIPWHDRNVRKGPVLYIAGEGQKGIRRRALGWLIAHNLMEECQQIPLYLTPGPINLNNTECMKMVKCAIHAIFDSRDTPKLIILDTWATCLGADENSTVDTMTGLDALRTLVAPYGAATLIVHHVGHGEKGRARGSSALHAALDMAYLVEKGDNGIVRLTNTKSKDSELTPLMAFKMECIDLGLDSVLGKKETTLVPEMVENISKIASKEATGIRQRKALDCLQSLIETIRDKEERKGNTLNDVRISVTDWKKAFKKNGGNNVGFCQVKKSLLDLGVVIQEGEYVFLKQS